MYGIRLMLIHSHTHYVIVPTSQSEVTVMQSHDNQPRQDDERSQVDDNNGTYVCTQVLLELCVHGIVM